MGKLTPKKVTKIYSKSSYKKSAWPVCYDPELKTFSVSLRSPINIALVKYWGKAHEERIIPTNNSLSLTINKD